MKSRSRDGLAAKGLLSPYAAYHGDTMIPSYSGTPLIRSSTGRKKFQSFEASNRGQFSCRCTLDQWLDLIGVISS